MLFGGIEGGATNSRMVIIDERGCVLASVDGPSTNHLYMQRDKFFFIVKQFVERAKHQALLSLSEPLDSLVSKKGLCLSGCQAGETNVELANELIKTYPEVSKHCCIANDCIGTMYTAPFSSGIVLIAGTGSNSIYFENRTPLYTCGGWGHLFDDEGSAYYIAKLAYKLLLDSSEQYEQPKHDLARLKKVVCEYIGTGNFKETIVDFLYVNPFDKKKFANVCEYLAREVSEKNDEAIEAIFEKAGECLGKMIVALCRQANKKGGESKEATINVLCTGSVFNSWELLRSGLIKVSDKLMPSVNLHFHLVKETSAFGAAKFAAKKALNIDKLSFEVETTKPLK